MGRHEQREQVFMLLFRVEFHTPEEMPRQERLFFEDNETVTREKDAAYIEAKEKAVRKKISEIDQIIDKNTEGWDTTRMGKVELTILRLAVYEMLFDEDVPKGVAIDEAVEIAKKFGQDNSWALTTSVLCQRTIRTR